MSSSFQQTMEIQRAIVGSWHVPATEDAPITVSFYPSGHFQWVEHAQDAAGKTRQVLLGDRWSGNWNVAAEPATDLKSGKDIFRGGRFTRASAAPHAASVSSRPFLVLNFKDLPKSIANIPLFGLHLNLADWAANVCDICRNWSFRIDEFEREEMRLNRENRSETWYRAGKTLAIG